MFSPFDDIIVLDFTHALSGPYCTMLLGAYGARVYKIESPHGGELARGWAPPFLGDEAAFFLGLNCCKQGVAIDLKSREGVDLCLRLIEKADVLVENFRIGTMDRLGLGYETARARNPQLIYCSISGYGQNGPARLEPAMDLILEGACGLLSVTGDKNGEPVRCGHAVADITAGMAGLIGILSALHVRERTGRGQWVDVSMLDSMISAMTSNFSTYFGSGVVPGPMGTSFSSIVPYRTFHTATSDLAIAVGSNRLWEGFCKAIGRLDLFDDSRYATNTLRVENRLVLEPLLEKVLLQGTAEEWKQRLSAMGVPCGVVRNLREVVEDPQVQAREMFPVVEHPTAGRVAELWEPAASQRN